MIVRRDVLRASKVMQERVFNTQNIEVLWEHQTKGLFGDGVVEGAVLTKKKGSPEEEQVMIKIDGFFLAIGHKPNTDIFRDFLETDEVGYIKTIPGTTKTNVPGIYACGDVAQTEDLLTGEMTIHGLHTVAVNHGRRAALNILGTEKKYEKQFSMNSLKELSYKLMVVGELDGEILKYKSQKVMRKIYIKNNKINGFVLLGDISNAGFLFTLLKRRKNIQYYKDYLLDKNFNPGYLITRFK